MSQEFAFMTPPCSPRSNSTPPGISIKARRDNFNILHACVAKITKLTHLSIDEEAMVRELQYNGYGDSGQIDEPTDLPQEIEYLGYEIIDIYFSGWENNEGADGTIVINFNEKTISIHHLMYYDEDENYGLEEYQLV